jgi:hypothetical protein
MSRLSCVYTVVVYLAVALTGFGQATQKTTALALPLAGPNRPSGVPADYVITPFGYFHPSCVMQLKKGESIQPGGVLRHADGSTEQVAPCPYPHYKPSGELAVAGSLDAHKTAVTQETDTTLPPTINGWVENSNTTIGTAYGQVVSTWTCPPLPLAQDGQVVFFFPGLEPLSPQPDYTILQPVLNYGDYGAPSYSLASWNCCPSNITWASSPINVSPGDTLAGTIVMTCAAGTLTCPTWNVISEDKTTSQSTELSGTSNAGNTFNWGFGGVLEAYNIVQCADYPNNPSLTMNTLLYDSNLSLVPSPDWTDSLNAASDGVPQCEYAVNSTTTNTTLTYGTTGPNFYFTPRLGGISVNQGGSNTWTFNVTPINGFSGPVSFSASNLPTGVSAQFAQGNSPNSYTLTLSATSAASLTGANQPSAMAIVGSASGVPTQTLSLNVYVNPPLTGGSGTFVDLSGAYDVYGFYDDADQSDITSANSLDGAGDVFSANQLSPPGTTPMGLNVNGTQFMFGPPNQLDSVYGTGANSIDLPSGEFASLNILATGIYGAQQSQTLTVTYTDTTTQEFTQTFDDWYSTAPSCTASNPCAPGESVAVVTPYIDTASGAVDQVVYLYAYSFALNASKAVKSLTLPNNRNVVLLAATLGQPWEQMAGSLSQISVGSDGTVWGLNSAGQPYMFNPQTQTWLQAPGFLTQITVASSGVVWGLNAAGQIYRYNPTTQNWGQIPGILSQLAVGSDGDVWGINAGSQIYHFNAATQTWVQIPGTLAQLAVGYDGAVWGINASQQVYRFNPGTQNWQQVGGLLKRVAVGADGDVWGINSAGQTFHFNALSQQWENTGASLAQLAVGSATNVWGLDAAGGIWCFNGQEQAWSQVPGQLAQIAVGENGAVWGLNSEQQIYQFVQPTQATQTFHPLSGSLAQIATGLDGAAWGIDGTQQVWHFDAQLQSWQQIPGGLSQIAVGFGGNVWGLNAAGQIWQFNASTQGWGAIPGLLGQLAVGADGSMWGLNSAGQIWRFNSSTQGFQQISGSLAQLAVGADGTVWGLNSAGQIFRFNPSTQGWDQIPGSLSQIAVGSANNVWGINAAGQVFRYDSQLQSWDSVPGILTSLAVAFDGTVWGVNSAQQVWRYNVQTQGWDSIAGQMSQISVGADAVVWGLNASGQTYQYW